MLDFIPMKNSQARNKYLELEYLNDKLLIICSFKGLFSITNSKSKRIEIKRTHLSFFNIE